MKLIKILHLAALFALLGLAGPGPQSARAEEPRDAVEQLLTAIQKIDHKKPLNDAKKQANAAHARQALQIMNVRKVSQKALGKHWKQRSSQEKKEFVALLGNIFKVVAFPSSAKFFGEMKITYGAVEKEGTTATVPLTVLHAEEGEVGLDFVLEDQNSRWRVVDVVLDGVSMRNNLRLQFSKVLKKHDYAELVRRMQKKLDDSKK